MKSLLRGMVVLLLLVSSGLVAAAADAPSKASRAEARKLARAANADFAKGDYEAALRGYTRAHELSGDWQHLEKVASTLAAMRRHKEARDTYARVLDAGVPAKKKKALNELVASLDLLLGTVLVVTSDPPGATVYINSRVAGTVGTTPFRGNVAPGLTRVILECERCKPYSKKIDVAPMKTTEHEATLELIGTPFVVEATPATATVRVDGADPAPAPYRSALADGEHVVVVEADGYEPLERKVVADGTPLRLVVTLAPRRD